MAKKKGKKKSKSKENKTSKKANEKSSKKIEKPNFYLSTTIFALIGTLIYWLIVRYVFSTIVTWSQILIFFVVFWIVYFFIEKKMYKKHGKRY